jgi:hypothetical protein
MKRKLAKTLKYTWGLAAGGASGAVIPYMQSLMATGDFSHIDLHKVAQTAMYGAILAVVMHYSRKPTDPKPEPPKETYKNAPANLMEMK